MLSLKYIDARRQYNGCCSICALPIRRFERYIKVYAFKSSGNFHARCMRNSLNSDFANCTGEGYLNPNSHAEAIR